MKNWLKPEGPAMDKKMEKQGWINKQEKKEMIEYDDSEIEDSIGLEKAWDSGNLRVVCLWHFIDWRNIIVWKIGILDVFFPQ